MERAGGSLTRVVDSSSSRDVEYRGPVLQTRRCLMGMVPFDVPEWPKCSQRRGRLGRGGEALFQRHWFHVKLRYLRSEHLASLRG